MKTKKKKKLHEDLNLARHLMFLYLRPKLFHDHLPPLSGIKPPRHFVVKPNKIELGFVSSYIQVVVMGPTRWAPSDYLGDFDRGESETRICAGKESSDRVLTFSTINKIKYERPYFFPLHFSKITSCFLFLFFFFVKTLGILNFNRICVFSPRDPWDLV